MIAIHNPLVENHFKPLIVRLIRRSTSIAISIDLFEKIKQIISSLSFQIHQGPMLLQTPQIEWDQEVLFLNDILRISIFQKGREAAALAIQAPAEEAQVKGADE